MAVISTPKFWRKVGGLYLLLYITISFFKRPYKPPSFHPGLQSLVRPGGPNNVTILLGRSNTVYSTTGTETKKFYSTTETEKA